MAPRAPGPVLDGGPATKTDERHLRAQAAKRDQARQKAFEAGRSDAKAGHARGHSAPLEADDDLQAELEDLYNHGYDEHRQAPAGGPPVAAGVPEASGPSRPAPAGGSKIEIGQEGASALLGIVAYALVLNYVRYGWSGVTGWFSAKFLNKPMGSPSGNSNASGQYTITPPQFDPSTGASVPGTGVAPGLGLGPGGTGYGTGNAPGYQPPGGYHQA